MFRTLLVPIDLSPCAHAVAHAAAELAASLRARVVLLYVVDEPVGLGGEVKVVPEPGKDLQPVGAYLRHAALSRLPEYEAHFKERGIRHTHRLASGSVPERILEAAEQEEADLVVMGTHGRTGPARFFLGSVAEAVSRRAMVPVMTIRTQHQPQCEARSCATCAAHGLEGERVVRAELDG